MLEINTIKYLEHYKILIIFNGNFTGVSLEGCIKQCGLNV